MRAVVFLGLLAPVFGQKTTISEPKFAPGPEFSLENGPKTTENGQKLALRTQKARVAGDDSYELFVFCTRWPATVCDTDRKYCSVPQNVTDWTIHGLWPNYATTPTGPAYCRPSTWDPSALAPIRDQLNAEWTDFEQPGTTEFWEHEWKKHGSCAGSELPNLESELGYFNTTLALLKRTPITAALKAAGVEPSWSRTLAPEDITTPLTKALGFPLITCTYDEKGNGMLLRWIELCYNLNLEVIDCPAGLVKSIKSHGCYEDGGFLWPPFGENP
eukprot:TRINITY_DN531_c0_g1_i1.p2 TRINITY_DN531_c0_g1~~TRINITY_DN531_c0_g1_i1.p2  ORF type:complete len:302 (-),score=142.39 TRINITY_DN531_c0_g1_i1:25-843(-)